MSPEEVTPLYLRQLDEQGLTDDDLDDLDEDERDEAIGEALSETVYQLLTPELRAQFIDSLVELRARRRQEGHLNELPRLAAVQIFLETDSSNRIISVLGLVQERVRRGISAGFEMAEMVRELVDEQGLDLATLSTTELKDSPLFQQLVEQVEQRPELRRFLEQQSDELMETGRRALFTGELDLDFFTADELETITALGQQASEGDFSAFDTDDERFTATMGAFVPQLHDYIFNLLTPVRKETLRRRIDALVADPDLQEAEWMPYLATLRLNLQDPVEDEDEVILSALNLMALGYFFGSVLIGEDNETELDDDDA